MSSLRQQLHRASGGVVAALRSLGPRWTAALAAVVLAVGAGGAVALTGGSAHTTPRQASARAQAQPASTVAQAPSLRSASQRPRAKRRVSSAGKHRKHVSPGKSAAKHSHARSPRSSHRVATTTHTSPSPTTTTSTTTQTTPTPSAGPASVTFDLHGGGNTSKVACGDLHHFRTYAAGSSLSFTGRVQPVPSGHWTVKLHIKICQGGSYQDFSKVDAHINSHTGAFHGSFSAPSSGLYEVRAVLYLGTAESTESDKVHLKTH